MMVTVPMKHVLKVLPQTKFIRVHRSHALNISYIVKIIGNHIDPSGQDTLTEPSTRTALVASPA